MAKKRITIVIEETQENSRKYWFMIYKGKPNEKKPEVQLQGDIEETAEKLREYTIFIENEL